MILRILLSCALYFILINTCYSQWIQIGSDIDGEGANSRAGESISIDGNGTIIAIGEPNNDGNGDLNGQVRVFELNAGSWTQKGNDINGESIGDFSGDPVSLNDNGTVVAIGAFNNDNEIGTRAGHVRVYEFINGDWMQKGSDINGEHEFDQSGSSISLNADGNIIAIGAALNSDNGVASGHVRIFEFINGNWVQIGNDIDGENMLDSSGFPVSINDLGNIVAIGAKHNDGNGTNSGHVRIFEFNSGNWIQMGSDIDGEAAGNEFGGSVSLNAAGNTVAIGAIYNYDNGSLSGHVRVYEFINGDWVQKGNDIDGEFEGDISGGSVSLNANGNIVAIGSDANAGNGQLSGHVRIFEFSAGNWTQVGASINGANGLDRFGRSVSINNTGNIVAGGATNNADNGQNSGHVRVFNNASILSVDDIGFSEEDILLYPNPTHGYINIQSKKTITIASINLMDIQGRVLQTFNLNCNSCSINLNNKESSGLYFLKINTAQGRVTKKILIN